MDIYDRTMLHALAQPRKGLFMEIQKNKFMNIYGSLMDIYDSPKREAQINKFFWPQKTRRLFVVCAVGAFK